VKVLNSESNGATTRYLHDISGLHSQQTPGGDWVFPIMDALGSLRGVVNPTGEVLEGQHYAPYGTPFGHTGTAQMVFGFTGEITDPNGLLNLRARYYVPALGVFPSLDPVEEASGHPYQYASADPINRTDPSGLIDWMSCTPTPDNPNLYSCYLPVPGWLEDSLQGVDLAYPELMDEILRINGVRRSGLSSNHINPQTPLNYQPRVGVGYYRHFAYDRDKSLLIPDSITASSLRLSNIIQRGRTGYLKSIIPKAPWTWQGDMSGYVEGMSRNFNPLVVFASGGDETVYNFATFQRMDFQYTGGGITGGGLGGNASPYFGVVFGFTRGHEGGRNADQFVSEYGGSTIFSGAEINTNPMIKGFVGGAIGSLYYRSLTGQTNGRIWYISIGAGLSLPFWNFNVSATTSTAKPNSLKNYIRHTNCLVDIETLEADILQGSHSPITSLGGVVEVLGRQWAATTARKMGTLYNEQFAQYCGCE